MPMTELQVDEEVWALLGLEPDSLDVEAFLEEAGLQFTDMLSVFY